MATLQSELLTMCWADMAKRKLLWLESCVPINTRSQRIIDSIERSGQFDVVVCAWNRSGTEQREERDANYRVLSTPIGHRRLVRKALALPLFGAFAVRTVKEEKPDIIGCAYWDMALIAATCRQLAARSTPVVYDVVDMPQGSGMELALGRIGERLALRSVSSVWLASRFFEPLYRGRVASRTVLENLPALGSSSYETTAPQRPPRVAYVGNVRYASTLEPLLRVARKLQFPLDIFGAGPDLDRLVGDFGACGNIRFHGAYRYADLQRIFESIDVVWAAYPADDENVKYAISNKYFECLRFGKPGVFSAETRLGELVAKDGTGFVVDAASEPRVEALIREFLDTPDRLDAVSKALLAQRAELLPTLDWAHHEATIPKLLLNLLGESD